MKNVSVILSQPVKLAGFLILLVMTSCSAPRQAFHDTADQQILLSGINDEAATTAQAATASSQPDFLASTDAHTLAPVVQSSAEIDAAMTELAAQNPKMAAKLNKALDQARLAEKNPTEKSQKPSLLASIAAKKAMKKAERLNQALAKDPNSLKAQKAAQANRGIISVGAVVALVGLVLLLLGIEPAVSVVVLIVGAIVLLLGLI